MGGNALSVPSTRLSRDDYISMERRVVMLFATNSIQVHTIKQLGRKETFGDLDVVISSNVDRGLVERVIDQVSSELVKNSDVWSFGIDGFQVDVVFSECPSYTSTWMAYSDASNIIGRLAHKLGLKHGHLGLRIPVRDGTHHIGDVVLSHNIDDIHRLLKLDHRRWYTGFDSVTEIYEWASQSPFYNPDIFLLDNRNAKARYRDSNRPTYTGLLEWIKVQPSATFYQYREISEYLPMIFRTFPESVSRYDRLIAEAAQCKTISDAWRTKLSTFIIEDIGLSGQPLGEFIRQLKAYIPGSTIVALSDAAILTIYDEFKIHYFSSRS